MDQERTNRFTPNVGEVNVRLAQTGAHSVLVGCKVNRRSALTAQTLSAANTWSEELPLAR
jgi:hypothetical protein